MACLSRGAIAILAFVACSVHAGRPLVTDDAGVVPPGACQIETWYQHDPTGGTAWFLPACTLANRFEFTLGRSSGPDRARADVLQVKTLFPERASGWRTGLALGMQRHRVSDTHERQYYAYVPVSRTLRGEQTQVHLNMGLINDTRGNELTWASAVETQLTSRVGVFAEAFGKPGHIQIGAKVAWPTPELQWDASVGARLSDGERTWTLGMVWVSEPFF